MNQQDFSPPLCSHPAYLLKWPSLVEVESILQGFRRGWGAWNSLTPRKGSLPPCTGTLRQQGREEETGSRRVSVFRGDMCPGTHVLPP